MCLCVLGTADKLARGSQKRRGYSKRNLGCTIGFLALGLLFWQIGDPRHASLLNRAGSVEPSLLVLVAKGLLIAVVLLEPRNFKRLHKKKATRATSPDPSSISLASFKS